MKILKKTKIAIRGVYISVFISLLLGGLTFWRTSVIITTYGTDVNSISQVASQIFSYLVLFESGLGAAYLFKMYEPFSRNEYKKVNSLYLGLTKSLRKISVRMLIGVVILAILYPLILGDNTLSYVTSALILFLLGIRFIFPYYFFVAKKRILTLHERQYIVILIDGLINSVIILIEISLAKVFGLRIEVILLIGILLTIFSNFVYTKAIEKICSKCISNDVEPSYEGEAMTKDILVHQICGLVNTNTDTIILSIVDLFSVTVYSAYNSVMTYPDMLVGKIIDNLRASLGLKLAKGDSNTYFVFREVTAITYFVTTVTVTLFFLMVNKFIILWIGEEFLLGSLPVLLLAMILLHRLIINTIYITRDGMGLYKESKGFTLLAAIINVVLSLILVKPFGIVGVLIGTVVSNYLIMDIGNFRLVYRVIFKKKMIIVFYDFIIIILCIYLSIFSNNYILNNFYFDSELTWLLFIQQTIIATTITSIISLVLLSVFNIYFRAVLKRLVKIKK